MPPWGRSSSRSSRRARASGSSSSSPPTTASRSASTARRRTASSPTRRPCACPSSFARRGSCPRESSATPVRHVDVVPTVLDLLGLQAPADLPGRSLLPLIAGREDAAPESYLESLSPSLNRGWAPLRGVVDGGLKYVDLPLPEIYDLAADPGERKNLAASRPQELERLRGRLARLRAGEVAVGARVQEDESALERLRALGYVAGGGASAKRGYTAEDDPKSLVDARRPHRGRGHALSLGPGRGGDRGVRGDPPPPPGHAAGRTCSSPTWSAAGGGSIPPSRPRARPWTCGRSTPRPCRSTPCT